jgi:hypothetical protein
MPLNPSGLIGLSGKNEGIDDVEWNYKDRVVALNSVVDAKRFCVKLHDSPNCSIGAAFDQFELFCD